MPDLRRLILFCALYAWSSLVVPSTRFITSFVCFGTTVTTHCAIVCRSYFPMSID